MTTKLFKKYFDSLSQTTPDESSEHTYRTHLETFLNELKEANDLPIQIIHEAKSNELHFWGIPDFSIRHKIHQTIIGIVETKNIGIPLEKFLSSPQIKKYQECTDNILLTDYLEWIWISKKEVLQKSEIVFKRRFRK